MSKAGWVAQREFMVRVRSRQFIIMTLLGPFLFSLMFVIPALLARYGGSDKQTIWVHDASGLFTGAFQTEGEVVFREFDRQPDGWRDSLKSGKDLGFLLIEPAIDLNKPTGFRYYSDQPPGVATSDRITRAISDRIQALKLKQRGLDPGFVDSLRTNIDLQTLRLTGEGEENSSTGAATVVGFMAAFIMYLFIFLYGSMVVRGVVEEKASRVMEVLVASVRPFDLMLGKILGIAAVGLAQFVVWIALTSGLVALAQATILGGTEATSAQMAGSSPDGFEGIMLGLGTLNLPFLLSMFLFYFISGYLLYAALFAAIGSAVDNESDTQQLMFPVTIPIILAIIVAQMVVQNPGSPLSFWFSMIPLTAPILMAVRLPFGVPAWELALSMSLMVVGFLATTWIAARIYRVGVLMYGKKPTFKELLKWITYKV
jgi:ABC-2 type transport system permease protein